MGNKLYKFTKLQPLCNLLVPVSTYESVQRQCFASVS